MTNTLRHWASQAPDRVAIRIGSESLSYRGLESQANQLARVFESMGHAFAMAAGAECAPRIGEHTVDVLARFGFDIQEIEELVAAMAVRVST